eukprot:comp21195_c0_seq1/m.45089 comp21195_c0_seq1/g.45089  ORF comp21195_c0_seq1/g.45089 comp21195_c0_seq1/m.45089 type:complete len:420 (-) comp21195_c0_seq1:90-1349(-)
MLHVPSVFALLLGILALQHGARGDDTNLPDCYPGGNPGLQTPTTPRTLNGKVCCKLSLYRKLCTDRAGDMQGVSVAYDTTWAPSPSAQPSATLWAENGVSDSAAATITVESRSSSRKQTKAGFFSSEKNIFDNDNQKNDKSKVSRVVLDSGSLELSASQVAEIYAAEGLRFMSRHGAPGTDAMLSPQVSGLPTKIPIVFGLNGTIVLNTTTPYIIVRAPYSGLYHMSSGYQLTSKSDRTATVSNSFVRLEGGIYLSKKPTPNPALRRLGDDPVQCRVIQMVGNVGPEVSFNDEAECIRVCQPRSGGDFCTPAAYCSTAIIPPNGSRSSAISFYYGVKSVQSSRIISLGIISKGEKAESFSTAMIKDCNPEDMGENWSSYGSVVVIADPRSQMYKVSMQDFMFTIDSRGAGNFAPILLPG